MFGIMLSEINQTEKANIVWCHLYVKSKKYKKLAYITKKQAQWIQIKIKKF